ncbi:MAG: universal stress protein [Chloroflexota bacterium]
MSERRGAIGPTILVALQGNETDRQVVRVACLLAAERGAALRGLYPVEIPLTLPLESWHEETEARAREVLAEAADQATLMGCAFQGTILPTRGAGEAIVDEAVEWAADVVVLASPYRSRQGDAALHVLNKAPCSVLLWRP